MNNLNFSASVMADTEKTLTKMSTNMKDGEAFFPKILTDNSNEIDEHTAALLCAAYSLDMKYAIDTAMEEIVKRLTNEPSEGGTKNDQI